MKNFWHKTSAFTTRFRVTTTFIVWLVLAAPVLAQMGGSPWENAKKD